MKQTQPYQNRIHVFHVTDGKIWTFKDDVEACQYIDSIKAIGTVGDHFKEFQHNTPFWSCVQESYFYQKYYTFPDIIMRDDYGEVVTLNQLIGVWKSKFAKPRYSNYFRVPGTKHARYGWYRQLKTTNERRQAVDNYDAWDEYGIVIRPRAARGYHGIPNSWDDYCRGNIKNWKKQRKTQWR